MSISSGIMLILLGRERPCLENLHSNQTDVFSAEGQILVSLTALPNGSTRLSAIMW